jgi:hypothetical protein
MRERARAWLADRRSTRWLVFLGALLTTPSLRLGFIADDYLHAIVLRHLPVPMPQRGPFDLFRFATGDPAMARVMMERGQILWTSDVHGRFSFFRPLSAATHVLDYALWPGSPWLMHAQSIAWYALALLAAAGFYRRFVGATWVAGLALFLYAVDHTHAPAVGWIAARNSLIALTLGLPVLTLHDRWRRDGWSVGAWAAPLLLGVALFAGESATAIVAYLVAYEVHLQRGAWREKVRAMLVYAPVIAVWRGVYTLFGHGVSGSGLYLDPARTPLAYLRALPSRLPALLLGEIALPPSDFSILYEYIGPSVARWACAASVLVLALLAAAMAPVWKRDPVARFFATGLVLAALPVCAAFPSDRLLLYVGLGVCGLVAQRLALPGGTGAGVAVAFLALIHVVVSPLMMIGGSSTATYEYSSELADRTIPKDPGVANRTVVLVDPPNDSFAVSLWMMRTARGEPFPAHLRVLASVTSEVTVTREDARSLRVRPANGFVEHEAERMLSDPERPLAKGAVVALAGMSVTVTDATPDQRPAEALFRFDVPLEDPSLVWLRWTRDGYAPWEVPAVGASETLPAYDFRRAVLQQLDPTPMVKR